MIISYSTR